VTDSPDVPPDPNDFEALFAYLKEARGFDFTAYKRATLYRRVHKRMQATGITDVHAYRDHLEVHPDEFRHLFGTILINVTGFFRDPLVWEYVARTVLPQIVRDGMPAGGLRVWSAGCASGEEPYTIAMLLAEALGIERFRQHVKIYATDVDDDALGEARLASYTEKQVESVPPPLRAKYFTQVNDRYVFDREMRRSVIFGRHDLLQDAPISRVSLLTCRNTFMYFNLEAQVRILERLAFALLPGGILVLGKAEMLLGRSPALQPADIKRRIFTKVGSAVRIPATAVIHAASHRKGDSMLQDLRLRDLALDADPFAQLVLDTESTVVVVNARLRNVFGMRAEDVGRPFKDLEISFRPVELRSHVSRVLHRRQAEVVKDVEWTTPAGESLVLDAHVTPLTDATGRLLGVKVLFREVTQYRRLQEQLRRSNQELETAYEELQSTNEELETTNEELQSTVEELETTNEELQSTNEELETMNEELQSTNEELQGANEELHERGDELNRTNSFLETILTSLEEGVAVVDRHLRVQAWNARAHDLWGLRAEEVSGQNLLNLDIGLPVRELEGPLRACLSGQSPREELVVRAVNRRGRSLMLRFLCSPLSLAKDGQGGAILLMLELPAERALELEARGES
jgi:two-component system, chemotaxis family, CheB/CheR fusion protein